MRGVFERAAGGGRGGVRHRVLSAETLLRGVDVPRARDSNGLLSDAVGTMHIYVRPAPDAPIAQPDITVVATEGEPLVIELPARDDDLVCSDVNVTLPDVVTVTESIFEGARTSSR